MKLINKKQPRTVAAIVSSLSGIVDELSEHEQNQKARSAQIEDQIITLLDAKANADSEAEQAVSVRGKIAALIS